MSEVGNRSRRSKHRFMKSAEASRAPKVNRNTPPHRPPIATTHSVPVSRRQPLLQRATRRLTSLSASKIRPSRLPVLSPRGRRHFRESSLILSSPVRRLSHLPEPFKKPLESPADKPLPSLPVASFVARSPVHRRSLLDATERPLRKSITPGNFEEWPALSPLKSPDLTEMDQSSSAIKPSLGESVLEGMRNLHLDDPDGVDTRNVSNEVRSKAYPVNHTPKPTAYRSNSTNVSQTQEGEVHSPFLAPRPAPAAPEPTVPSRTISVSSLSKRSSLQALSIFKLRRDSKDVVPSKTQNEEQSSRPSSSYKDTVLITKKPVELDATPLTRRSTVDRASAIPRFRGVSASGSPYASPTLASPKTVQLKRAKAQIFDVMQQQDSRPSTPTHESPDTAQNWVVEQESPMNPALIHEPARPESSRKASLRTSSNATVRHNSNLALNNLTSADKENFHPHFDEAQILRMKNFKFPVREPKDIDEDTRSELTRITSASSKAGTIYAQDEHGGYRLKPLSQADPKHGPRVRIEDAADDVLLDLNEEQLAHVEAKRAAYLRKYPSLTRKAFKQDTSMIPEFTSLRSVSNEARDSTKVEEPEQPLSVFQQSEKPNSSAKVRKLAPQVPTNIPSLAHSPVGWPLMVSKIAPFAEIEAGEALATPRRSTSDCDLQKIPSTPHRDEAGDECPGSAYTLRTALNKFPRNNSVKHTNMTRSGLLITDPSAMMNHKQPVQLNTGQPTKAKARPRKSLPELVARPFLSTRNTSKNNAIPLTGLKKETNELLESYSNQRASLQANKADAVPTMRESGGHSHAHPPVSGSSIPSSPRYVQSFNTSLRQVNVGIDISSDLPSTPPVISGSVTVNRPTTMKTKLSGIFHKPSKEGILRRSMSKITMKTSKELAKPLSPLPGASPLSSPLSRHDSSIECQPGATIRSTPPSSYLRHKPSRLTCAIKSPHNEDHRGKAITLNHHPISEDTSLPNLITSALEPVELRDATQLAFTLLDRARGSFETSSPGMKRHEYVDLAKAIATTVTVARDVEKSVEEAKQAAFRAEMDAVKTKKAVVEVCDCVEKLLSREGERMNNM